MEQRRGRRVDGGPYCGVMDDVLVCSNKGGVLFSPSEGRWGNGRRDTDRRGWMWQTVWERSPERASWAVCQLLPGSVRHAIRTRLRIELLCLTGNTRRQKQPDGGMHRRLSVRLREGAAAAHGGWLGRSFYRTRALIICTHG